MQNNTQQKEAKRKQPKPAPMDSQRQSWDSFPKPQGWAMDWQGEALPTRHPDGAK